ncbi:MAG: hypothetical protein LBM23_01550 [Propionibacteriaceae bacterium]|nr:hypothetical protein [Propionibacteriaceae bacterium]
MIERWAETIRLTIGQRLHHSPVELVSVAVGDDRIEKKISSESVESGEIVWQGKGSFHVSQSVSDVLKVMTTLNCSTGGTTLMAAR